MKLSLRLLAGAAILAAPALAHAQVINPTSYDMPNGSTGAYVYWDKNYTGSGNTQSDFAPLSGGLGDLTDGVIPGDHWYNIENTSPGGEGPWVGWAVSALGAFNNAVGPVDPIVVFHFAGSQNFGKVHIYFDDTDGFGGVDSPLGVNINGVFYAVTGTSNTSFWADFDVSGQASAQGVSALNIEMLHGDEWVFAGEVTFEGNAIATPEPASIALMGTGLLALGGVARRRRQKNS